MIGRLDAAEGMLEIGLRLRHMARHFQLGHPRPGEQPFFDSGQRRADVFELVVIGMYVAGADDAGSVMDPPEGAVRADPLPFDIVRREAEDVGFA